MKNKESNIPSLKIIETEDGSLTLMDQALGEIYHSRRGAITESRYVFLNRGLKYFLRHEEIFILEVGFGTGLNTLLTCLDSGKLNTRIFYDSVESNPLPQTIWDSLNYTEILGVRKELFDKIHLATWDTPVSIEQHFILKKIRGDIRTCPLRKSYHLIYFDAFSPEIQPELWTQELFNTLFKHTRPGGILVTYSAKSAVRNALKACGWVVEKLPGPPGKREMIRARRKA